MNCIGLICFLDGFKAHDWSGRIHIRIFAWNVKYKFNGAIIGMFDQIFKHSSTKINDKYKYEPSMWFVCHVCEETIRLNKYDIEMVKNEINEYIKNNEKLLEKYNVNIIDRVSVCNYHGKGVETMILDMVGSYLSTYNYSPYTQRYE